MSRPIRLCGVALVTRQRGGFLNTLMESGLALSFGFSRGEDAELYRYDVGPSPESCGWVILR